MVCSVLGSSFWEKVKEILSPGALGAKPWIFYTVYAFLVFAFNIFDIVRFSILFSVVLLSLDCIVMQQRPSKSDFNDSSVEVAKGKSSAICKTHIQIKDKEKILNKWGLCCSFQFSNS